MRITVGIATWNRAAFLRQTLASLTQLKVPPNLPWEVLVCDNNSSDDTRRTIESFSQNLPMRYLSEARQGKSFALNHLVTQATGDWLLFVDDDVLVDGGWLVAYVGGIGRYPQAVCMGGPIEPWLEHPVGGRKRFLLEAYPGMLALLSVARDTPMNLPDRTAYGANMAMRRDRLGQTPFDEGRGMFGRNRIAGEDVTAIKRVLAHGGQGWLLADAKVWHHVHRERLTSRYVVKWQMAIGATWIIQRGRPAPGRLGVPWWAWMEFLRRSARAAVRWRPWPSPSFYHALTEAAQYLGYLRAR